MMLSPQPIDGQPDGPDAAAGDFCDVKRGAVEVPSFEVLYDEHVNFVYRSVRRLGVAESAAEDVTQDVFITIHRRLSTFEGRSSLRTWIFGVVAGIVRNHRRRAAKRNATERPGSSEASLELAAAPAEDGPHQQAERQAAVRTLHAILAQMDEDKRELFVLAELEQTAAAEIAELTNTKLFTVYSRLRVARAQFKEAASRFRASDGWRIA